MFIFNCYVELSLESGSNDIGSVLISRPHLGSLLDIGRVECEPTDRFSNPVIFQCGLEKKSAYEVKKAQGSLLVNEFSEFQIFLLWRVLENDCRKEVMGHL